MRAVRHEFFTRSGWPAALLAALLLAVAALVAVPDTGRAADPGAGAASGADTVLGLWLTGKKGVMVDLFPCDQALCGRIAWLAKPYWKSGALRRDEHNPDKALRDRPWCGIQAIHGLESDGDGSWEGGHFYNPKDGSTYKLAIRMNGDGTLNIRAYLGIKLLGMTEVWTRPGPDLKPGCVAEG